MCLQAHDPYQTHLVIMGSCKFCSERHRTFPYALQHLRIYADVINAMMYACSEASKTGLLTSAKREGVWAYEHRIAQRLC